MLVSARSAGDAGNAGSLFPACDGAGTLIAFRSDASDLVASDLNGSADVFVRDVVSGVTTCASTGMGGATAAGISGAPDVSLDGRYVVFESNAPDIVPGDTNGKWDVFRRDLASGQVVLVSRTATGVANGDSRSPTVSDDGRIVAFVSSATDLVAGDTNGRDDVFVHDVQSGETSRASLSSTSAQLSSDSFAPSISGNGSRVAFTSSAAGVVPGDTNGLSDVFVRDLSASSTERVSLASDGTQANLGSFAPAMSGDGMRVAFESMAWNLVPGDDNGVRDIFLRDMSSGSTVRVSVSSSGAQADAVCQSPAISADGSTVAFSSGSSTLSSLDTNGVGDVFVRRLASGQTSRVSMRVSGAQLTGHSHAPSLDASGGVVAFHTFDDGVGFPDSNGAADVVRSKLLERSFVRVQGSDRYSTAVQASLRGFPAGAGSVVIATGRAWPDALGGSALAGAIGGPVLLTNTHSLPPAALSEIKRLGATRVYLLGGERAVGPGVEATLGAMLGSGNVVRLPGADRYATASLVASAALSHLGPDWDGTVLVATGRNYPDAIAGSSLSAGLGWPILLSSGSGAPALPSGTSRAIILGGTKAVPSAVESALRSRLGTDAVYRVGGTDRYSTAAAIADFGVGAGLDWHGVALATGENFPDALTGGTMASRLPTVMLLTRQGVLPAASQDRLLARESRIATVHVLGGPRAVAETVVDQMRSLLR